MFKNMVTLFNYAGETNESPGKYFSTLFENVELQPKFKTRFTSVSTQDSDNVLLIVKYQKNPLGKFVEIDFVPKYFLPPKKWEILEDAEKDEYFTLQCGRDFFAKGNVPEYYETYEEVKNDFDSVFFVNSVKDFEDDLKHWEIEGY